MLYLLDRATGRVVARYKRDYKAFIRDEWGGWYPYVMNGAEHYHNDAVRGCEDYTKVWSPCSRMYGGDAR